MQSLRQPRLAPPAEYLTWWDDGVEQHGLRFGDVLQLIRTILSGSPKGPDVYQMILLLGRDRVVERMVTGIETFNRLAKQKTDG